MCTYVYASYGNLNEAPETMYYSLRIHIHPCCGNTSSVPQQQPRFSISSVMDVVPASQRLPATSSEPPTAARPKHTKAMAAARRPEGAGRFPDPESSAVLGTLVNMLLVIPHKQQQRHQVYVYIHIRMFKNGLESRKTPCQTHQMLRNSR